MGRSAMNTRLPYASAVPSGVATNLAVALSASVPLESVAFRASRITAAAASGAEAGACSASDMVVQRRASGDRGQCWSGDRGWQTGRDGGWSRVFVIHPPRGCWSRIKATFPKAANTEEAAATRSHSAHVSGNRSHQLVCVHTACVRLRAGYGGQPGGGSLIQVSMWRFHAVRPCF